MDLVYKSTLKKQYLLTDKMISELGAPDKEVPNPHYRSQTSKLYSRIRVEDFIERLGTAYLHHLKKREKRSKRASEVMANRIAELEEKANNAKIEVFIDHGETKSSIKKMAALYFEEMDYLRGNFENSRVEINSRGIVAFVRHQLTNYESLLQEIEGKPGVSLAYMIIRDRVNRQICNVLDIPHEEIEIREKMYA